MDRDIEERTVEPLEKALNELLGEEDVPTVVIWELVPKIMKLVKNASYFKGAGGIEAMVGDPFDGIEPRMAQIIREMLETSRRKGHDYGNKDPYANIRACEAMGIPAWQGVTIRLQDKMARVASLAAKGTLKNEAIEDTFLDIAVYAIIARIMFEETK